MSIDHMSISVRSYDKSKEFFQKALAPLGLELVMEFGKAGGFGAAGKPFFWFGEGGPDFWKPEHRAGAAPVHVAFLAKDRSAVDTFYAAALAAGGTDHGAPGVRVHYHPGYYGAFVLDLDGNNIEAVCHQPG